MKIKHRFLQAVALGLLAGPMAAQANEVLLIDHPASAQTQVFGINDRGDVVGNGTDPVSAPFVYSAREDTFTDIPPAAGFLSTGVLGTDDAGNLVGSVNDGATTSGFIRDKKGVYTIFTHPDAFSATNPRAVNNKGQVSGFSDRSDGTTVAFIYDSKTGTFTDIDNGVSLFTIAHGINSKGEVVGNSFYLPSDDPCGTAVGIVSRGWLRSADGNVTYFTVNDEATRPRGINDRGDVVGAVNDFNTSTIQGFKVKPDGSQCQSITVDAADLIQVMGFESTFPEGISNSGDIVGIASDFAGPSHGFIIKRD